MQIGSFEIGPDHPTWVIAEIGINHNGDVLRAREMVHAAKESGADALKVQSFHPAHFTTKRAMYKGESQYDLFSRYVLTDDEIRSVADECRSVGIEFFGTPDCLEHAKLLVECGANVIKVGSDDLMTWPLLKQIASLRKPMILSTGMADQGEVIDTVKWLRHQTGYLLDVAVMVCTSLYPCPLEHAGVGRIQGLSRCFSHDPVIGYSDHTDSVYTSAYAVAAGARMVEKHFTLDRSLPGPDQAFSADPDLFAWMVSNIRDAETISRGRYGSIPDKEEMRPLARRSIVASTALPKGVVITEDMLAYKRPGDGLLPNEGVRIVGRKLRRSIDQDGLILEADTE